MMSLAIVVAAGLLAGLVANRAGSQRLQEAAVHRLDVISQALDEELTHFEHLPVLLEMNPKVMQLLSRVDDPSLRYDVNLYLRDVGAAAGATIVYVLDHKGVCIAASDWNKQGTPLGTDLSFRPYVRDAMTKGMGHFYGVGVTTRLPGYYMSYALSYRGNPQGVAAVKISLASMEKAWNKLQVGVLVLDERDVVILTSHDAWRFRPLQPLTSARQIDIDSARPYGPADLTPLDWRVNRSLAAGVALVTLDGKRYLAASRSLQRNPWKLVVLEKLEPLEMDAHIIAVAASLTTSVLMLIAAVYLLRRRSQRQRRLSQAALQEAHDQMDSRILERTADLASANEVLAAEVRRRMEIEAHLRRTQDELVHAGKMAVLGQMAAGLAHEVNQPLAAIRTLSDNSLVLMRQDRTDIAAANLTRIAKMVDRIAAVTGQLRTFSHKGDLPAVPVSVSTAVSSVVTLLGHRLHGSNINVEVDIRPPTLTAYASEIRLEQVLVNLVGNAIDAIQSASTQEVRIIAIVAYADGPSCVIAVTDTGTGIRPDILERLFEPFATSKPPGAGLGLGLMISAHIVRQFRGTLTGRNTGIGACFELRLPGQSNTREESDDGAG